MIDPITKLHSPVGALLSVYVNRRPPATRAAIVDLLKPLRRAGLSRELDKSVRADSERIVDLASRIESDAAPAVAVFASHTDRIFETFPLAETVDEYAGVGPRPYLRPLRAQRRPMRVGVLVADSTRARTYVLSGGGLHEVGDVLETDRGKDNYGGFAGYDEHHVRSRADDVSAALWKRAGRRLLDAHQDLPFEMMVIAGHDETFDVISEHLHAYLQQLPQARLVFDPNALTPTELMAAVTAQATAQGRSREMSLLDRLSSELGRGGLAVAGVVDTLAACNAHAVEHLLVAGPFAKPGVVCDGCGWLGRSADDCPVCAAATFSIDDVVGAAMDAAVDTGAKVDVVSVAGPLDAVGVGALLRFRLG